MILMIRRLLVASLLLLGCHAAGADPLTEFGLRAGIDAGSPLSFHQYGVFARTDLPWYWDWPAGWRLASGLEGSLAVLHATGDRDALLAAVGPLLQFSRVGSAWSLELGVEPAYLSIYQLGSKDFGGHLQFVSHVALRYRLGRHWILAYRFQHMSDAGIKEPNPGLNEQVLELAYRY